ncbi:MAG: outer membrane beta-barrel protein [Acidobacteriota bacterium]
MKKTLSLATVLVLFGFGQAMAEDRGLYVAAKLGSTDVEAELGDTFDQVIDGDEDSTTFEIGFKVNRFWAVQAGYHDFGDFDTSVFGCEACGEGGLALRADTKAYSLSFVPQLDLIWRLSVFGKVGLVIWESEIDALDEDFTEEDIIYGLGARFRLLGNLSVFAEWEQIASDIETVSLGAHLQF